MFHKLEEVVERFREVEGLLSEGAVLSDRERFLALTREHADLREVVETYQRFKKVCEDLDGARELLQESDPELKEMARAELPGLEEARTDLENRLQSLLLPRDPNDDKNIFLEIRAGTGGEEAALFAYNLYRMYQHYAETKGWKVETMSISEAEAGGFKEAVVQISGDKVYSRLKYESGTHRVQRVPATETQGRIHTSACTVAVLPEAAEVDLDIDPGDLRIDVFRASGSGGQHVNKTESAVRITHLPTGVVVSCQDEKSQHKNKAKAMKVLRSRILSAMQEEQNAKTAADRKSQVGSGDRSERIRTYNYPQGRVTDHRIGLTLYRLESIVEGDLDEIIDGLTTHYQAEALSHQDA
ncbi:MAG: peptide chain release factor 1 [Desulfuromonadaceae bacterium]|nr:peptide chain release factor 1 [Desulfuromonadaceae bacterium]